MAENNIPDTENLEVAVLAVAWQIVSTVAVDTTFTRMNYEERLKRLANDVVRVEKAIRTRKELE